MFGNIPEADSARKGVRVGFVGEASNKLDRRVCLARLEGRACHARIGGARLSCPPKRNG